MLRIWFSCLLFQSDKLVNCEWRICLVLHSSSLLSLTIDAKSKIVLIPFTLFPCSCNEKSIGRSTPRSPWGCRRRPSSSCTCRDSRTSCLLQFSRNDPSLPRLEPAGCASPTPWTKQPTSAVVDLTRCVSSVTNSAPLLYETSFEGDGGCDTVSLEPWAKHECPEMFNDNCLSHLSEGRGLTFLQSNPLSVAQGSLHPPQLVQPRVLGSSCSFLFLFLFLSISFSHGQFLTWTQQYFHTLVSILKMRWKEARALNDHLRVLIWSSSPEVTCAVVQSLPSSSPTNNIVYQCTETETLLQDIHVITRKQNDYPVKITMVLYKKSIISLRMVCQVLPKCVNLSFMW